MKNFSERWAGVVPRDYNSMSECIEGILEWCGYTNYTVERSEGISSEITRRCGDGVLRVIRWGIQNDETGEWYLAVRYFSDDEPYMTSMRDGLEDTEEEMLCKHFQVIGEIVR